MLVLERCSILWTISRLLSVIPATYIVLSQTLWVRSFTALSDLLLTWDVILSSFFLSDDCSLSIVIMSGRTLQCFPQVRDTLHSFLRNVLFVMLYTKMSARFLCRLNAIINGSRKTDIIFSDL